VSHRPLALLGVAVVALVLAAPALAVRVHVRVEGATTTIFGATEPRLAPVTGTFSPPAGEPVTVNAATPLGALERASRRGEFHYRLETFGFGAYVAQIGRRPGSDTTGWVYKVNGVSPPVGADAYELKEGDRVLWYFARFGLTGGPKTLRLLGVTAIVDCFPTPCPELSRTCYSAVAEDDNGRRARVRSVVFRLDGRRIASRRGRICPRGHWHSLRLTKRGFVRSQVVGNRAAVTSAGGGAALAGRGG
jgi:hypothetical protein